MSATCLACVVDYVHGTSFISSSSRAVVVTRGAETLFESTPLLRRGDQFIVSYESATLVQEGHVSFLANATTPAWVWRTLSKYASTVHLCWRRVLRLKLWAAWSISKVLMWHKPGACNPVCLLEWAVTSVSQLMVCSKSRLDTEDDDEHALKLKPRFEEMLRSTFATSWPRLSSARSLTTSNLSFFLYCDDHHQT
jgi:hypothetical protein